ncbi:MAG: pyruvate kinase [Nitrospirota bacterium]
MRRAKIVCTIGPASNSKRILSSLIKNGMDVARLNFSHGTHEEHGRVIRLIREIAGRFNSPVAIIQDLQGLKIRVGKFREGEAFLKTGTRFTITTRDVSGDERIVSTSYKGLPSDVRKGNCILLDDGIIKLEVLGVNGKDINCRVIDGGMLKDNKGMNLPGVSISASTITKKDIEDIAFGLEHKVDYIALSFVRSSKEIKSVKDIICKHGADIPVIAKIEKPEAVENLDEILGLSDGIMVARGDLGVEMSPEKVPIIQKEIIKKANEANIPVITATQMLESMTEHPRPTRAEASDVANAVLDETDVLMLSAETSLGKYPVESLKMMVKIIEETERVFLRRRFWDIHSADFPEATVGAASLAAKSIGAKAMVAFTKSGLTALLISKQRPPMPIIALTPDDAVRKRMSLYWGVIPLLLRKIVSTDEMIDEVDRVIIEKRLAKKGDGIVILSGAPIYKKGTTNLMKLHRVGE